MDPFEELASLIGEDLADVEVVDRELVHREDRTQAVVLTEDEHAALKAMVTPPGGVRRVRELDAAMKDIMRGPDLTGPISEAARGWIAYNMLRLEVLPVLRGVRLVIGKPMDKVMQERARVALDALIDRMDDVLRARLG